MPRACPQAATLLVLPWVHLPPGCARVGAGSGRGQGFSALWTPTRSVTDLQCLPYCLQ